MGLAVGVADGDKVGLAEGLRDGPVVGLATGAAVGVEMGAVLGFTEGNFVGGEVAATGCFVGAFEGALRIVAYPWPELSLFM